MIILTKEAPIFKRILRYGYINEDDSFHKATFLPKNGAGLIIKGIVVLLHADLSLFVPFSISFYRYCQ